MMLHVIIINLFLYRLITNFFINVLYIVYNLFFCSIYLSFVINYDIIYFTYILYVNLYNNKYNKLIFVILSSKFPYSLW